VIDVGYARADITAGIVRALDPAFRRGLADMENVYGDGSAAPRIASVLRDVKLEGLARKRFVDR
jgi:hypothetical protein